MKSILFLVFIILSIVASCKKDSEDAKDQTPKVVLTSHGWKISSVVEFGDHVYLNDYKLRDCDLDNCLIFKPDGTFIVTFGSNKCDPNESDEIGNWYLYGDGKSLNFYGSPYYSIFSIDLTSLVLKWEYGGWGWEYTYIPC